MSPEQEAILRTFGTTQSLLVEKVDSLILSQQEQTVKLHKIDVETSDIRAAWAAAAGGWKVLEFLSKIAKVVAPIILSTAIIISVTIAHTKGYWRQLMEALSK